jgi:thiamine-phosphate pyrophosphorylase
MSKTLAPELLRVCDANLNRLREGIRVVEDIARYSFNNKQLSTQLKALRHQSRITDIEALLSSRDSINDVLKTTQEIEMHRSDLKSIVIANYKRAQESSRVLEELFKIIRPKESETFKKIRYELYALEKGHILNFE